MTTSPSTATSSGWRGEVADAIAWVGQRLRAVAPRRADLVAMGRSPRRDLVAGMTVGVVALPLALAFGISSGLGATAGLVTAVVAGTVAALFGGSSVQVSGPTGAMTVVLIPIVAQYGRHGVLLVGLMAGALLVAMALAGVGRFVRFLPLSVVEGFTAGIAAIIALQQVPTMLGVDAHGDSVLVVAGQAVLSWLRAPHLAPLVLSLGVATVLLLLRRVRPTVPVALVTVGAATLLTQLLSLPLTTIGALPSTLPTPRVPDLTWWDVRSLAAPALAVAALAGLESLLSATVADAMRVADRHDPDRELFGQGLANLAAPLFGGLPATAAIARTAVNVRSGARSRLAAVVHALVLLLVILFLGPVVSLVPVAALAGVLIATAVRMSDPSALRALLRSGRGEAVVLGVTFAATVLLDLASAVVLGILVAGALALRHVARSAGVVQTPLSVAAAEDAHATTRKSALGRVVDDVTRDDAGHALLDEHIVAYRVDGSLFFGAAHAALDELTGVRDGTVVILRLSHLADLDATGAAVLTETVHALARRRVTVLVSGLQPAHEAPLRATGLLGELLAHRHVFRHTPDAIAHARRHVARDHHHATDDGGAAAEAL